MAASGKVISNLTYSAPVHQGHRTRSGSIVMGRPYLLIALRRQRPKTMKGLRTLKQRMETKRF